MNATVCLSTTLFLAFAPLAAQETVAVMVKTNGALTAPTMAALAQYGQVSYSWPQIHALALDVPATNVAALASDPNVAHVELDDQVLLPAVRAQALVAAEGAASAPVLPMSTSWNQDQVDTLDSGLDGDGVTVVVIDTGLPQNWADVLPPDVRLDLAHSASFAPMGRQAPGVTNYINTSPNAYVGLHPHGLGVTSIVTGFRRLPGLEFVHGAAPKATILPIRIYGQGRAQFSWVVASFLYVAELKRSGALPGPVVVNFSSQGGFSAVIDAAVDYLLAQGVLFVTIAGNFADLGVTHPGSKPETICAGGAGFVGEFTTPLWYLGDVPENNPLAHYVAFFSGREPAGVPPGSLIDVLGPGDWVISAWAFGNGVTDAGYSEGRAPFRLGIAYVAGTSFAAPHVTAVVAQMLQRNPNLTQAQAEAILRGSALPIPPNPAGVTTAEQVVPGWGANATGAGLLRGGAAVAATPIH